MLFLLFFIGTSIPTRALLATEIGFASEVVGSGMDWMADAEWDDEQTLRMLRDLQWKLSEFVLRGGAWETSDRD